MAKIIAVTNSKLCTNDFLEQIQMLVEAGVDQIILREKDMSEKEYTLLAGKVMKICEGSKTICSLHKFIHAAHKLNAKAIHLSVADAIENKKLLDEFEYVGISIHSMEQLEKAQNCNADYVFFGHVFATDCKKGVEPRGIPLLKQICDKAEIPVYAIGGITQQNAASCIKAGTEGVCVMSFCMKSDKAEIKKMVDSVHFDGRN